MNPLKIKWYPEVIESTPYSQVTTPPCGKPDPHLPRISGLVRDRVYQKGQVGPTCMYYAARRISPHFGKCDVSLARMNEKILSYFRKHLASVIHLDVMPLSQEYKTFLTNTFVSFLGLHVHFPFETFCMSYMIYCQRACFPVVSYMPAYPMPAHVLKNIWDYQNWQLKIMVANSLRLMLHRMFLAPLMWRPSDGPEHLVSALRVHLYLFCIGDFGAHVFEGLKACDSHPKLGPIYSGALKPIGHAAKKPFSLHAILVIGLRVRGFMRGEVYFIDPNDPSGPGLLQKVYQINLKDFLYRIRDSAGCGDLKAATGEFIWVGNPRLFLA